MGYSKVSVRAKTQANIQAEIKPYLQPNGLSNGLSKLQIKVLNTMLNCAGAIVTQSHGDVLAIVPRGDRRCRPAGWVGVDDLQALFASGIVEKDGESYVLAASYRRRALARSIGNLKEQKPNQKIDTAKAGDSVRTFSAQHRESVTRQVYHPDGIARPTQTVYGASGLDRVLRMKDKAGQTYFDAHELEAAARFVADCGRANMVAVATQNYSGVSGGTRRNTAEDNSISAIDARKRVMDARAFVGTGLSKSLDVLRDIDVSMGSLERSQNWARGSGKTVLRLALTRLSDFYGTRVGVSARR